MKNLSRLLVATMIASALFVGCGNKEKEAATETEVAETAETVEETAEEVEEEVEEEKGAEEGTLEAYFEENPDELDTIVNSSSSDEFKVEIECEGNKMTYHFILQDEYTDEQIAAISEQLKPTLEEESMKNQMETSKKLMATAIEGTADDIEIVVIYEDAAGNELGKGSF